MSTEMCQKKMRPEGKGSIVLSAKYNPKKNSSTDLIDGVKIEDAPVDASDANSIDVELAQRLLDESEISTLQFSYPLKLFVPEHASSSVCKWIYPISCGGGLVEGDNIVLTVDIQDKCSALITTQASTKVYHCLEGKPTTQTFTCHLKSDTLLTILPDPVVCFKDAIYCQKQDVFMNCQSNLILLDWQTAGRVACGELWQMTKYSSCTKVHINNKLVFRDSVVQENSPFVSIKASMKHYTVVGYCILLGSMFSSYAKKLVQQLGKPRGFGASNPNDSITSISSVHYKVGDESISGCVIRFCADDQNKVYNMLSSVLQPWYPLIGGDPFENKH